MAAVSYTNLDVYKRQIVDKGNQQMTDGDSLNNLAATADPVYERQVDALMEKIMACLLYTSRCV